MEKIGLEEFREVCKGILAQSNNCTDSQQALSDAKNVPEIFQVWKKFWDGVCHEVPEQVVQAFTDYYPTLREDINLAGVYFNESPGTSNRHIRIIVGNADEKISIGGASNVYVLGKAELEVKDKCHVLVNHPEAKVTLCNNATATLESGSVECYDYSTVRGSGDIVCHDKTTVVANGGSVVDYGHHKINAYGETLVSTFTERGINLFGHSKALKR